MPSPFHWANAARITSACRFGTGQSLPREKNA
jgi:hypothetical protein